MFQQKFKYITTLLCLLIFTSIPGLGKDFILIIDPGHGGKDPGAIGTYSKEKNINLNVALKVGELIKRNCPEIKLIYTRKTDVFVELDERANIANKAKADLFISIHTNALEKGREIAGSETYSLGMARANENLDVAKRENAVILYESNYQERYAGFNPNSSESYIIFDYMQDQHMKQSAELANAIQKQYANAGRPNKGVHQAGFLVLRKTSMPSVLTELGFITTPREEQYMNSAKGTDDLARSIYNGLMDYLNKQERHKSVILANADEKKEQLEAQKAETAAKEKTAKEEEVQTENKEENTLHPDSQQQDNKNKITETETSSSETSKENEATPKVEEDNEEPIFKIQFLTSPRNLRKGAAQFKGLDNVSSYLDKNTYKYTYGSTNSYKEIVALRKTITDKFPDCFIIAFRGKEKISVQEALKEEKNKGINNQHK